MNSPSCVQVHARLPYLHFCGKESKIILDLTDSKYVKHITGAQVLDTVAQPSP